MIEKQFDVPFVADLALREKQIQQNYRPVIAVHKWFARRPGTLFRALLLSEFVPEPLRASFYRAHNLDGIRVGDPFMGGGTPLIEANRLGCEVVGYDINPMAYWIVWQEIRDIDVDAYRAAASALRSWLEERVGDLYRTTCAYCGATDAQVKYFLWVKAQRCVSCGEEILLFPGYLVAENRRHPMNVLICSACGAVVEVNDRRNPGACARCGAQLTTAGRAARNRVACPHCGKTNSYPDARQGPPQHAMVAIEYHCPSCRLEHVGRYFKEPDGEDLARYDRARARLGELDPEFIPDEEIPRGDETDRLHRWGYRRYREMFNDRQLLGLELSCRYIAGLPEGPVRDALATNLSDLLRYQNMLCRYDTMALKSLDIFSVHGFPVGLMQCESNLLGIPSGKSGSNLGSGGWSNVADKYAAAKEYCRVPFEVRHYGQRKVRVPIGGEWIGLQRIDSSGVRERRAELHCESATRASLAPGSLDAVLTDPPYFSNVQYAELMDFCYVWLRRLAAHKGCFARPSTRSEDELTGNATMDRGLAHFAEGLSEAFVRMARALKPGAPFAFTYHHNTIEAYLPVAAAILDAGLVCSASLPCPAEMGASIHINGTGSSIVDTVFVCRATGVVSRHLLACGPEEVARLVQEDVAALNLAGLRPTRGDMRCIAHGHLIRMAVWNLRRDWDPRAPTERKLRAVSEAVESFGGWTAILEHLDPDLATAPLFQNWAVCEGGPSYRAGEEDEVSF